MRKIETVLLVLVTVMGMAMPVLGAEAGSSAGASANWDVASQFTTAWANTEDGDEYAIAGTGGASLGNTGSTSGAGANDLDQYASAETAGGCSGLACYTNSGADALEWDADGQTDAVANAEADGIIASAGSEAYSYWGPPIESESGASAEVVWGWATSDAGAEAYVP